MNIVSYRNKQYALFKTLDFSIIFIVQCIDIEVENSDCLNVIDKVPSIDSSMSKIITIIKKKMYL